MAVEDTAEVEVEAGVMRVLVEETVVATEVVTKEMAATTKPKRVVQVPTATSKIMMVKVIVVEVANADERVASNLIVESEVTLNKIVARLLILSSVKK